MAIIAKSNSLKHRLIKAAMSSFALRIAQAFLGLAISMILARQLGAEGLGDYAAIVALFQLIALPVQAGLATLLARQIVRLTLHEKWEEFRGLLKWSFATAGAYSIAGIILFLAASKHSSLLASVPALVVIITIPSLVFSRLLAAYLRGSKRVVLSQSFDFFRNLIIASVLSTALFISFPIEAQSTLALFGVAAIGAVMVLVFAASKATPTAFNLKGKASFQSRTWIHLSATYMLINGVMKLADHIGILLTRSLGGSQEAGLFQPAYQLSTLILFGLAAVTMSATPYFTHFHEEKDHKKLQVLAKQSARASFSFALLCATGIAFFGENILVILYGQEFAQAQPTLLTITVAYLIQAFTGASAPLLVATGHEKKLLRVTVASLVVSVATSFALIPTLGGIGAALSIVTSMATLNLGAWWIARQNLGVRSDPLP